jgi:hypothetical protein
LNTVVLDPDCQTALDLPKITPEQILQKVVNFSEKIEIRHFLETHLTATFDLHALDEEIGKNRHKNNKRIDLILNPELEFRVFETNAELLTKICETVLEAVIQNYSFGGIKLPEELSKLRTDYSRYVRGRISVDRRKINNWSPRLISEQFEKAGEEFWKYLWPQLKKKLEGLEKEYPPVAFKVRGYLRSNSEDIISSEIDKIVNSKLKYELQSQIWRFLPKEDVLVKLELKIKEFEKNIAQNVQMFGEEMLAVCKQTVSHYFNGRTTVVYKTFPDFVCASRFLTPEVRKFICLVALNSEPEAFTQEGYEEYYTTVVGLLEDLGMRADPEVYDAFERIKSQKSRRSAKDEILAARERYKQGATHVFEKFDAFTMAWLITGLYMMVVEDRKCLEHATNLYRKGKAFQLGKFSFRKRDLLFNIIRYLRNEDYPILNFQIALMAETALETFRYEHNKQIAPPVPDFPPLYVADYKQGSDAFRRLPTSEMVKIAEQTEDQSTLKTYIQQLMKTFQSKPKKREQKEAETQNEGKNRSSQDNDRKSISDKIRDAPDEDDSMENKLDYLKDCVKIFGFTELSKIKEIRSRVLTINISGFLSQTDNASKEWRQMIQGFPFTEQVQVDWESYSIQRTFGESMRTLVKVKRRDLINMFNNYIHDGHPGGASRKLKEDGREDAPSWVSSDDGFGPITNPFTFDHDTDFHENESNLKVVITELSKQKMHEEEQEQVESSGWNCMNMFKKTRPDPRAAVRENLAVALASMKGKHITPEMLKNPEFKRITDAHPAFKMTSGVYDFYKANPFSEANHHAVMTGQMLALLIGKANIFNGNPVNLMCYSLGSVFVMSTCLTLYDLGCTNRLGDVCFMGACNDLQLFAQSLHKLIGSKGVVQGKLIVMYSIYDTILAYIFKAVRLGEVPLGYKRMNLEYLADCMKSNDPAFKDLPKDQVMKYIESRMDNLDVSEQCENHFVFKYRLRKMLPMFKFGGDFKESQSFAFFDDTK